MANLDYYIRIFKNNQQRLLQVVSLIIVDLSGIVASSADALKSEDFQRVHQELHKARPILFNLKEEGLVDSIDRLKYIKDTTHFTKELNMLLLRIERVVRDLKEFLDE